MSEPVFSRVLLKLSGEVLSNDYGFGISPDKVSYLAEQIKPIYDANVDIGLIIGAGNIFRGMEAAAGGMDRVTGDYLGMLATIMNAISLQDSLEKIGCETRTLSAINVTQIAEPYIRRRAIRHMEKGRIVIIAGGTGNPFFTTDSAAALRATELGSEIVLKGTKVDGVFDKDPEKYTNAKKYKNLSYQKVIQDNLRVMDMTAITLCSENNIPINVFNIKKSGNLLDIIMGSNIGTIIGN
ncbi:MAG: UMP kinase [bacterium TMED217]|nr:MAG: UMP kinase [bacterium TMED217]|tara:strand:+ start:26314 stop:27030 length:717 start_codon:yes stop_codon:yes gene_type:complete